VPQSLHRTWSALGIAALAVLFVAFFVGRDVARDVYPSCGVSLEAGTFAVEESAALVPVSLETTEPAPSSSRWFQLRFNQKTNPGTYGPTQYSSDVRVKVTRRAARSFASGDELRAAALHVDRGAADARRTPGRRSRRDAWNARTGPRAPRPAGGLAFGARLIG
jgi:hypothetical protein